MLDTSITFVSLNIKFTGFNFQEWCKIHNSQFLINTKTVKKNQTGEEMLII